MLFGLSTPEDQRPLQRHFASPGLTGKALSAPQAQAEGGGVRRREAGSGRGRWGQAEGGGVRLREAGSGRGQPHSVREILPTSDETAGAICSHTVPVNQEEFVCLTINVYW